MSATKSKDPYANPRAFYGSELERLRNEAGLSQTGLGTRAFCSGSYIGQFESALRIPQLELSKRFDEIFGTGKHMQRLCKLARRYKVAHYFEDAAELERQAKSISEISSMYVLGLLQTEAYARAVTLATQRFTSQEVVERLVRARMERSKLLESPSAPVYWAIIHEAALRVAVGGPEVMGEQLDHLVEVTRTLPNVVIQVMPFAAGAHRLLNTMVSLMEFSDAPPAVYTEGADTGQLIEDPILVAHSQRSYDLARADALSPAASLALVESAAKDWTTHGHHI
ncbi:helix-turn-helix transcriptional regulator [Streptomyces mobaraensis NBRC 13819 = DSM 40847]|uniref:Helix-turn-helix domain-containing protein n=1 Tax=Streptomyces mobaraensis (strain ATCC 29032 / DSM 40847 / JCM 4168 / NBRC 13819 / NCIMB 11159 / IPCR 16-22) TaxID=1223523 RepID=M3A1Z4_STRM1|nr:helix-turn-helix transcriptional regulator [Streptomyces mobaraensis]EME99108.1 helix-turn-helix domain-containing protein [Streptomyces mobaraensis NBRC 13819 = DSM 40847]QTT76184.1 helix-turn-helix transcriptional regulator [Streptomyces mobaraensis NBRC 13819 = DSM 40847]